MKVNNDNFVQLLKLQQEDALEFIVDKYLPLIKGITHKVLGPFNNNGLIEECINDVFLSIWNNASKFYGTDEADFKKWIGAIAKFKSIDYYRKASKQTEFTSDLIQINETMSAEEELVLLENRNELIRLINDLEPVDRDIFIMKFLLGLKTKEIAAKLGLTKASIANRIYRGKKQLNEKSTNLTLGENSV